MSYGMFTVSSFLEVPLNIDPTANRCQGRKSVFLHKLRGDLDNHTAPIALYLTITALEKPVEPPRRIVPVESRDRPKRVPAHPFAKIAVIASSAGSRTPSRSGVPHREEDRGLLVKREIRDPADVGAHDRDPARHRLRDGVVPPRVPLRVDEEIRRAVAFPPFSPAEFPPVIRDELDVQECSRRTQSHRRADRVGPLALARIARRRGSEKHPARAIDADRAKHLPVDAADEKLRLDTERPPRGTAASTSRSRSSETAG